MAIANEPVTLAFIQVSVNKTENILPSSSAPS